MTKKRILAVTDASKFATGYAGYAKNLLQRLHNSGYEVAELACGLTDDQLLDANWTAYPNIPRQENLQKSGYNHSSNDQFGKFRFNEVCLKFRPDIVITWRDYWMDEFIARSPFRDKFHFVTMATVDGVPQPENWINFYSEADALLTYTDWGKRVLEEASNGRLKVFDSAPPAANTEIFKPVDSKKGHKEEMGLDGDSFIIGTIMRNQVRKLYPQLFQAFRQFLESAPKEVANKTYLWCHVGYPDLQYDIPNLIKNSGISNRILFTYICVDDKEIGTEGCDQIFPSFFQDASAFCPSCKKPYARLPNTHLSARTKELANIINCFDLYVQYSTNEGFGMPLVEAAACGVPIAAVDYSAMVDILDKIGGIRVKVKDFYTDVGTSLERAMPSNEDLVSKMVRFFSKPQESRDIDSKKTVINYYKNYDWDETAKKWIDIFETLTPKRQWNALPRIFAGTLQFPPDLNNKEFVDWCFLNILNEPSKVNGFLSSRMLRNLNYGFRTEQRLSVGTHELSLADEGIKAIPYGRKELIEDCAAIVNERNMWEQKRVDK